MKTRYAPWILRRLAGFGDILIGVRIPRQPVALPDVPDGLSNAADAVRLPIKGRHWSGILIAVSL
jgi:hypothetical protein